MWILILYFIIGVSTDIIYAGYIQSVARKRILMSGIFSFLMTAIVMGVILACQENLVGLPRGMSQSNI